MPHTNCRDNLVTFSEAATLTGKPYQYIRGIVLRSATGKKRRVYGLQVNVGGTMHWRVCSECIVEYYGKAGPTGGELIVTPHQGYRQWYIVENHLSSAGFTGSPWLPGKTQAVCRSGEAHEAPQKKCSCGLYALANVEDLWYAKSRNANMVTGAVELWGRVVPGFGGSGRNANREKGWRAQYGKPVALLCDDWFMADDIHRVAELYRIPVTHSIETLKSTVWGEEVNQLGYWQGGRGAGGPGEASAGTGALGGPGSSGDGRAPCRVAAAGAVARDSLKELKFLLKEKIISRSNFDEVINDYGEDSM